VYFLDAAKVEDVVDFWNLRAMGKQVLPVVNNTQELTFRFKPLLPKFATERGYHGEPRCANEISFRFYGSEEYLAEVLPKSSGEKLTRAIAGLTSFLDWRVGRNGLVKLVKNDFAETRDIPAAESIMFAWLTDLGWKPELSPPGLLAKQIYKRFEGHVMPLQNEKLLGLLEHMNGGSVKQGRLSKRTRLSRSASSRCRRSRTESRQCPSQGISMATFSRRGYSS